MRDNLEVNVGETEQLQFNVLAGRMGWNWGPGIMKGSQKTYCQGRQKESYSRGRQS